MLGVKRNHGQNPTQFIQKNNLPPRTIKYEKGDLICSPEGIRTLVAALRRQSPRPLDDGATFHFWKVFLEQIEQLEQQLVKLILSCVAGTALGYQDSNLDLLNQNQQGCQLPHTPRLLRLV